MSGRSRRKRESQFARNLAAIKTEFKLLLGTIDPISAFNYLHHEGIVSKTEKEEFDEHVSLQDNARRITVSGSDSVDGLATDNKKRFKKDPKLQQAARDKLTAMVECKEDHNELKSIVLALNAFKKLHQSVLLRRQTEGPRVMDPLLEGTGTNEGGFTHKEVSGPEGELLSAFEQGTLSPEELIQLLGKHRNECVISELANFEGKTLLHLACCMQPVEVVKALVTEHNCQPNAQDTDGNTALHEASRCRKPIVANLIVKLPSCDPNIANKNQETPLHLALRKQHWRLSKVILKSGKVDGSVVNAQGLTPLELIEKHPQNHERTRMKKLLERNMSILSNTSSIFSDDSDISSPPMSPTRDQSDMPVSDQHTVREGTAPTTPDKAKQNVLPKSKGILRPFNPNSIRTSELEIVVEGLEDSDGTLSSVSLDSRNLLQGSCKQESKKEKFINSCYTCAEVFSRLIFLLIAIGLCVLVLVLLCVFLVA